MTRKIVPPEERCQERVSGTGPWGAFHCHQCENRAVVVRDDKRYCKIHDPEYIAEKSETRTKKWEEQHKHDRVKYAGPLLLQACKDALEASHDPKVERILQEAINKAEGK